MNIKKAIEVALNDWDLDPSRMVGVTTDNASNNISACDIGGESIHQLLVCRGLSYSTGGRADCQWN